MLHGQPHSTRTSRCLPNFLQWADVCLCEERGDVCWQFFDMWYPFFKARTESAIEKISERSQAEVCHLILSFNQLSEALFGVTYKWRSNFLIRSNVKKSWIKTNRQEIVYDMRISCTFYLECSMERIKVPTYHSGGAYFKWRFIPSSSVNFNGRA